MSWSDYLPASRRYVKELVMATVQELEQAIAEERDEVGRRVNALVEEVERLKAQVGSGTVMMPSDFDHLIVQVRAIHNQPEEPTP